MIAYRCPVCGKNIMSMIGVFALTGDMVKLKCDCGHSELTMTYTPDRKIRLTVPCIICPNPHNYLISSSSFFNKELFTLSCTYSDVDICFIGLPEKVKEALKQSDEELIEMLTEAGFDDYDQFRAGLESMNGDGEDDDDDDPLLDEAQIGDIVRFMLAELREDGDIRCGCEDGEGDYGFEIGGEGVTVFCKKCGRSKTVKLNGTISANAFLHTDRLVLKDEVTVLPDFGEDDDPEKQ